MSFGFRLNFHTAVFSVFAPNKIVHLLRWCRRLFYFPFVVRCFNFYFFVVCFNFSGLCRGCKTKNAKEANEEKDSFHNGFL